MGQTSLQARRLYTRSASLGGDRCRLHHWLWLRPCGEWRSRSRSESMEQHHGFNYSWQQSPAAAARDVPRADSPHSTTKPSLSRDACIATPDQSAPPSAALRADSGRVPSGSRVRCAFTKPFSAQRAHERGRQQAPADHPLDAAAEALLVLSRLTPCQTTSYLRRGKSSAARGPL